MLNAAYQTNRVTENEWKNDFELPKHLHSANLLKYKAKFGRSESTRDGYGMLMNAGKCISLTDISTTKKYLVDAGRNDIKVIVKGVMCKEDASAVIEAGANAIWVSNGGYLKSEGQPSTISVLSAISKFVKARYPNTQIFIDSGVRRGTDILKCVAYGADAVFVGRPVVWGLHAEGENGVRDILTMLNDELTLAMALTHCFKLSEITEEQVIYQVKARL